MSYYFYLIRYEKNISTKFLSVCFIFLLTTPPVLMSANPRSNDSANHVGFRNDGVLMINGDSVFPIGIGSCGVKGEHLKRISDAGFNVLLGFDGADDFFNSLGYGVCEEEFYHEAQQNNLYVLAAHYQWAAFNRYDPNMDLFLKERRGLEQAFSYQSLDNHRRPLRTPLQAIKDIDNYSSVIGWYLSEEPKGSVVEPLEFMYQIFKSNSPHHIVTMISADPVWYPLFRNATDVLLVDHYPFRGGFKRDQPIINSYNWTKGAVEAMQGKPVWLVTQLYQPSWWSGKEDDELTLQQMRMQHYLGILAGAKGFIMYDYLALWTTGRSSNRILVDESVFEKRWERVTALIEELQKLGPLICNGSDTDLRIDWSASGSRNVNIPPRFCLDYYGSKYLFVVNVAEEPLFGHVPGSNYGNPYSYKASILLGQNDIRLEQAGNGNQGPRFKLNGFGCGVIKLDYLPLKPQSMMVK